MSEPRTHYQISLTARQAVGLFAGLLLALGLAFFFGLMAGYSGRDGRASEKAEKIADASIAERTPTLAEALPPVETGVPLGAARPDAAATTPPPEPTTPATIHPFDDSAEDEAAAAPSSGSRTSVVGAGPVAAPPAKAAAGPPKSAATGPKGDAAAGAGKVWVQAASLSSHDEANAMSARLSKHGFHAVVLPASGPRGKVYRVRVGPYRSEDEASHAMGKLSKQEKIRQPWIVPDGK